MRIFVALILFFIVSGNPSNAEEDAETKSLREWAASIEKVKSIHLNKIKVTVEGKAPFCSQQNEENARVSCEKALDYIVAERRALIAELEAMIAATKIKTAKRNSIVLLFSGEKFNAHKDQVLDRVKEIVDALTPEPATTGQSSVPTPPPPAAKPTSLKKK